MSTTSEIHLFGLSTILKDTATVQVHMTCRNIVIARLIKTLSHQNQQEIKYGKEKAKPVLPSGVCLKTSGNRLHKAYVLSSADIHEYFL